MLVVAAVYGLLTALIWGVDDFLSRRSSRYIGYYLTAAYVHLVGALLLISYITLSPSSFALSLLLSKYPLLLANIGTGAVAFLALLFIYRGLAQGIMSIVAPVAGSYPAVTNVLAFFVLGEAVAAVKVFAIGLVLVGVLLSGVKPSELRRGMGDRARGLAGRRAAETKDQLVARGDPPQKKGSGVVLVRGVDSALAGCLCSGAALFGVAVVGPALGAIASTMVLRVAGSLTGFGLLLPLGLKFKVPKGPALFWVLVIGTLDVLGFLTYNAGIMQSEGNVPIVATLSGLISVVTLLLATAFYGERLEATQVLGIVVLLAGVLVILYF